MRYFVKLLRCLLLIGILSTSILQATALSKEGIAGAIALMAFRPSRAITGNKRPREEDTSPFSETQPLTSPSPKKRRKDPNSFGALHPIALCPPPDANTRTTQKSPRYLAIIEQALRPIRRLDGSSVVQIPERGVYALYPVEEVRPTPPAWYWVSSPAPSVLPSLYSFSIGVYGGVAQLPNSSCIAGGGLWRSMPPLPSITARGAITPRGAMRVPRQAAPPSITQKPKREKYAFLDPDVSCGECSAQVKEGGVEARRRHVCHNRIKKRKWKCMHPSCSQEPFLSHRGLMGHLRKHPSGNFLKPKNPVCKHCGWHAAIGHQCTRSRCGICNQAFFDSSKCSLHIQIRRHISMKHFKFNFESGTSSHRGYRCHGCFKVFPKDLTIRRAHKCTPVDLSTAVEKTS